MRLGSVKGSRGRRGGVGVMGEEVVDGGAGWGVELELGG